MFRRISLLTFLLFAVASCHSAAGDETNHPVRPSNLQSGWNRNLNIGGVPYDIYVPTNFRSRALLLLPGWNFPKTGWIDNTRIVAFAEKFGYALAAPEMLRTVYESEYFPETTLKWNPVPGGRFIKEIFLPELRKRHGLFNAGQNNAILGLSTGGRGVALVSLENPGIFRAAAALSGDFSQENMPGDNLMRALYGPIPSFRARWTGRDNPMSRVAEWQIPLYLSHGRSDTVVPEAQSRLFYEALKKQGSSLRVVYDAVENQGHDYRFWDGRLDAVFNFFEEAMTP